MIIDAHMHMDSATTPEILKQQGITCIVNAANAKGIQQAEKAAGGKPGDMDQCRYPSMAGGYSHMG